MRSVIGSPFFRRLVVAAVVTVLILVITVINYTSRTQAAPEQPMPFPHVRMVSLGIQCTFCHTDVQKSPAPGMPSVEKCMGCHKVIATDRPAIQQLAKYWTDKQPIPWVRISQLPRYQKFSHQVHVTAGALNCERCHGDVGKMQVTHQVTNMNMGWCLDCHNQQPNAKQLIDCVVCHF